MIAAQISQGNTASRDRQRQHRDSEHGKPIVVENKDTKKIVTSLDMLSQKALKLTKILNEMQALNIEIAAKQGKVEEIKSRGVRDQEIKKKGVKKATKDYVRARVNYSEVDAIFDDIIDEQLNGVVFSMVNLSMLCVMALSVYLWLKLKRLDN